MDKVVDDRDGFVFLRNFRLDRLLYHPVPKKEKRHFCGYFLLERKGFLPGIDGGTPEKRV